jgi:hypothetical protein
VIAATTVDRLPASGRVVAKPPWALLGVLAMASAVPTTWFVVTHVQPTPTVHAAALFTHLVFVVVGFGAVLTVDWVGALWAVGKRSFEDVLAAGANVSVPIWIGFTGLVASGLFLEPDLGSTITQVKLALVFVAGWNGIAAGWLHARLAENPQPAHFSLAGSCATVSQACWWGALVIGHVNAQ